jgi:hypothetical protein
MLQGILLDLDIAKVDWNDLQAAGREEVMLNRQVLAIQSQINAIETKRQLDRRGTGLRTSISTG